MIVPKIDCFKVLSYIDYTDENVKIKKRKEKNQTDLKQMRDGKKHKLHLTFPDPKQPKETVLSQI